MIRPTASEKHVAVRGEMRLEVRCVCVCVCVCGGWGGGGGVYRTNAETTDAKCMWFSPWTYIHQHVQVHRLASRKVPVVQNEQRRVLRPVLTALHSEENGRASNT